MLTGSELLAKVKELGAIPKSELVRACGYVSIKKDGTERLNFTAFYEALLTAKGLEVGLPKASRGPSGPGGRRLSYMTKVQFNGNLLVGSAYTAQLDFKPGDQFEIKLGRKQITLIPAGSSNPEPGAVVDETATACTFGPSDVEIPSAADLSASITGLTGASISNGACQLATAG